MNISHHPPVPNLDPVGRRLPTPAAIAPEHDHPHRNFDRAAGAAMARLSGGVSTHAFIEAWSDWVQHLARSPGRQLELIEHAQQNVLKLMALAISPGAAPPFAPKPYDHRFDYPD